jgi:hypothetical protein
LPDKITAPCEPVSCTLIIRVCVLCEVCHLGEETVFVIKTTCFITVKYSVHCKACNEAEETGQHEAYDTKYQNQMGALWYI